MARKTLDCLCDIVVCLNETDSSGEDVSAKEIKQLLSREVGRLGLEPKVRVSHTNCMGFAGGGLNVALYPYGIWFSDVTADDVDRIIGRVRQILHQ